MTHPSPSDELVEFADLLSDEQTFPSRRGPVDPRLRRRRIRRALLIVASVLATVLLAVGGYVAWALTAPLSAPTGITRAITAPQPPPAVISLPTDGAAAAISVAGAEEYLGPDASAIWMTSGTPDPRPTASISKLITALVILEEVPLANMSDPGPTITFSKADHDLYDAYYVQGATVAAMPTGSAMSLHDALATMLIPSASNYAEAVSTWAFGSQSAFLRATREWLDTNGLTQTTIIEPTGLSPRNTSTPSDMIAIGKLAQANPTIAQITSTASITLPGPGTLTNTNDLLGTAGITGLKTGSLGDGAHSLLYTADLDVGAAQPLHVTGVVLGGSSRPSTSASVTSTLDSLRAGFRTQSLAQEGELVGSYSTPWGSTAQLVIGENASILTWSDTPITVTMDTTTPTTYQDGEIVGTVTWTAGPNTATAPVQIQGSIVPPDRWWRLTHPSELGR